MIDRGADVERVNVVAHLLALVTVDSLSPALAKTTRDVSQEAVRFGARMIWPVRHRPHRRRIYRPAGVSATLRLSFKL